MTTSSKLPSPGAWSKDRLGVTFAATEFDPRAAHAIDIAGRAVGWVRIVFFWSRIEPQRGSFDWRNYDTLVNKARADGVKVLGEIAYTTQWSTSAPSSVSRPDLREHYPPAHYADWDNFVGGVVNRYKDRIQYWEVWNEPDLRIFWGGSAADYAKLLANTQGVIKRAEPQAQVVMGGLALGGQYLDVNFLTEILNDPTYPAGKYFDIANFHDYGPKPEALRRLKYLRAQLTKVGAGDRPVWVTEVGYPSNPGDQADSAFHSGPPAQAAWLADRLPYLLTLGIERVFWHELFDHQTDYGDVVTYGLLDTGLSPKPAFQAYRNLSIS